MDVLEGAGSSLDDEWRAGRIKPQEWEDAKLEEMNRISMYISRCESVRGINMLTEGCKTFWCFAVLVAGFVAGLPVAGASSATAPESSTPQIYAYAVGAATFILLILGVIGCWLKCFRKRARGDGEHGVLDMLFRLFRERLDGMFMSLESLEVGEAGVARMRGLIFDSRV